MSSGDNILSELNRAKVLFQQRAVMAVLGIEYGREVVRGAGGGINRSVAIGGAGETSPEYIQNGSNHVAAHYSAPFYGSIQLTTICRTAPF